MRRIKADTGLDVAANPLMLQLGVRALLIAGTVVNPAETFHTLVRSIVEENGYTTTSVYEAGPASRCGPTGRESGYSSSTAW